MKRNLLTLYFVAISLPGIAGNLPINLKVNGLVTPLGIDTPNPTFSWQTKSDERGFRQSAYELVVKTVDGSEVWNSGKVASASQNQIAYAGSALNSCTPYVWSVTVYDKEGKASETAKSTFETAFLQANEWEAQWIQAAKTSNAKVEIPLTASCRYVKLDVTKLGLPASTDSKYFFLQLAEMEIYSGGENVARTAKFSASDTWTIGNWNLNFINDGIVQGTTLGYTSTQKADNNQHIYVIADLGKVMDIERIVLYPRQDDKAASGTDAANFPSSYTIQTSEDNKEYAVMTQVTNGAAPSFINTTQVVPYLGKNFSIATGKKVKRARIYASALGVFTMTLNGRPVTDNKLEPGESEYEKTILYSTYDVTSLLKEGVNTWIGRIAGGIFHIDKLTGRFSKGEVVNSGDKALKAELHIDYEDGTSEVVLTDGQWTTAPSPTLGSNWWGGEDYDARNEIVGIDEAHFDVSAWTPVSVLASPTFKSSQASGMGVLKARNYEPVRVVEEWKAVTVKSVYSGGYHLYVVDFGRNFAGQYRFRLKGKNGQIITLREGESLNADGSVFMENYYTGPADTYETYTFAGKENGEEWGPEFMYHGFRYLQIIGLEEAPSPEDFTAMRLRSDMDLAGTFETSNSLLNDIHVICRDAIQSQLYNLSLIHI